MTDTVKLTIELPRKVVECLPAIAVALDEREASDDIAAEHFYRQTEAIYKATVANGTMKFGEEMGMTVIGLNLAEGAKDLVFEAAIIAVEALKGK